MNRVIFAFRDERPKLNHATIQRIARDLDQAHPMSFSPLANEILRRLKSLDRTAAKRSEEHTSELQSLMRISYAVFCLKKKKKKQQRQAKNTPNDYKYDNINKRISTHN